MKTFYSFFTLFSTVLNAFDGKSQISDSVFYNNAINQVKAGYFSTVKEKARLYNGIEYEYFGRGATGSPFFMVDSMQTGSVFYDGILYEDVLMRYDMVNDAVLVKYPQDNNTIQLIKNKVDYFSLLQHTFVRVDGNEQMKDVTPGFYELLYKNAKVVVLAKRTKQFKISSNTEEKAALFVQADQYFVYKDDKYSTVNSQSDLVNIFNDKATEIKKFLRTGKVKFKQKPAETLLATALFYNGLTK